MAIKTVTIIGASGNIGTPILSALLASPTPFTITALTRAASTSEFPPAVRVLRIDLTSLDAVTSALTGQDAVISALPAPSLDSQRVIIDACVAAGVQRFLPSEFGYNSVGDVPLEGTLGALLAGKGETIAYLQAVAAKHAGFSWTGVATSPFFDWGLDHGMWGIDWEAKTARLVDSGDEKASTSSLPFIGQAVRRVLETEKFRNQAVDVVDLEVSLNEVRGLVEEAAGVEIKVTRKETAVDVRNRADEMVKGGNVGGAFLDLLLAHAFEDGKGRQVKKTANVELGLVGRTAREIVGEWVKAKQAKI